MFTDPLNSIHGPQIKSHCSKHEQMKWVEQNLAARLDIATQVHVGIDKCVSALSVGLYIDRCQSLNSETGASYFVMFCTLIRLLCESRICTLPSYYRSDVTKSAF